MCLTTCCEELDEFFIETKKKQVSFSFVMRNGNFDSQQQCGRPVDNSSSIKSVFDVCVCGKADVR